MNLDIKQDIISETSEIKFKISKYDHAKKLELVRKINKIKKKEYLYNIFKMITSNSKDYTENTNGVFIFFHNLEDEVYDKVETYVNNIYKLHKKNSSLKSIIGSEFSDSIVAYSETINDNNDINDCNDQDYQNISKTNDAYDNIFDKDTKDLTRNLSNKEKMIIKRKKYEEYLNQNQSN